MRNMNATVFENVLACVENMDDAQTSRLLAAVLKKKQVVPIMCFIKADYDAIAKTVGEEPLTSEEFQDFEARVMSAKRSNDMSLTTMLQPLSTWLTKLMAEVKGF